MIKYAIALRLGTAETEAILKRVTRNNLKHPTYLALAELGKAIKNNFLCRYLHSEALRRKIQEGLNVIDTGTRPTASSYTARAVRSLPTSWRTRNSQCWRSTRCRSAVASAGAG